MLRQVEEVAVREARNFLALGVEVERCFLASEVEVEEGLEVHPRSSAWEEGEEVQEVHRQKSGVAMLGKEILGLVKPGCRFPRVVSAEP